MVFVFFPSSSRINVCLSRVYFCGNMYGLLFIMCVFRVSFRVFVLRNEVQYVRVVCEVCE